MIDRSPLHIGCTFEWHVVIRWARDRQPGPTDTVAADVTIGVRGMLAFIRMVFIDSITQPVPLNGVVLMLREI